MKKIIYASLMVASIFATTSCESYLDVNTNPNGPDALLQPELFLPAIQSELAVATQWDGRFAGFYTQNWGYYSAGYSLDLHNNPLSDSYAQLWRAVYWSMGYNLSDMIESAELNKKYDFAGVGYIMRALGWQNLTDYHGPVIVTEAFDPDKRTFNYDEQQVVYAEIQRLLMLGIENLERTDGLDEANSGLSGADLIYGGNREQWKKFAYGLLAINAHRLTNKSSYDPNKVIEYVDKSFTSNADDALIRFQGEVSTNSNFFGPRRGNIGGYRQTKFIVGLLDGSNPALSDPTLVGEDPAEEFAGQHLKDPRLTAMLAPAPDGQYRGVTPGVGLTQWTDAEEALEPKSLWNSVGTSSTSPGSQIYIFGDNALFPLMTYAQLQFIKAEAAWIANKKDVALDAYTEGVNAHMDFARSYAPDKALFDQRRAEYMASEELMPTSVADLTLSKIMLQKYIATWAWGFLDTWSDMRRYHYDQGNEANPVYVGFELPEELYSTNQEKPAYRARPRFNSEYMWNKEALEKLGGFEENYHTFETWFSKPE
ncbi:SusD/RagB family nutrient-binding outer membrane lipoprotein [Pontibacter mangrovi]|uniref:SusD/RagB family nutrient-binding outer membrane lipoprotein n=1 Tax=Pontibacter mangrovi TaxID=2589816 RepID=A0A501WGQ1_9BACT|nr:SusD/RagB family nutrient-binding outer membrane lipoprotein [Pontibacter mangrovi]TPE46311.1 SusD/RagB family nutrient-binding outer membrane lipoprotein [Pontibacter mangrovi]